MEIVAIPTFRLMRYTGVNAQALVDWWTNLHSGGGSYVASVASEANGTCTILFEDFESSDTVSFSAGDYAVDSSTTLGKLSASEYASRWYTVPTE